MAQSKLRSTDEIRAEAREKAFAVKRLFSTPDGKMVLRVLEDQFEDRRLDVPNDPYATHVRVGERNVVQFIKTVISEAIDHE